MSFFLRPQNSPGLKRKSSDWLFLDLNQTIWIPVPRELVQTRPNLYKEISNGGLFQCKAKINKSLLVQNFGYGDTMQNQFMKTSLERAVV